MKAKNHNIIKPIKSFEAKDWCLYKHYAKRVPNICFAFGLFIDSVLEGVVTYGMPASPNLCLGICGEKHKSLVLELNRLCLNDGAGKNGSTFLIARSIKLLPKPRIIVSYADIAMNHVGYVYQAANFIYTGATKERTDISSGDGRHSRHYQKGTTGRVTRSSKHRYVYFHGTNSQKKELASCLNYKKEPYPKGEPKKYDASYKPVVQAHLF